ncbi:MAG: EAL domain-containing protein [Solobacterium sp.]|nr:EAL domain-containing protein [Solobacterium sp.]
MIRWQHPEFGLLTPFKFVPMFEKNGMIQKLDRHVWEQAAKQIAFWKEKYEITIPVSVNVSRIDLYDPELEEIFMDILKKNGLHFSDYHLEITESVYSEDTDLIINVIRNLREKGFIIEMDDFGAGYSSLGMVSVMPIDVLKLDMAFARNVDKNAKNYRMVEIMKDIAGFMDVSVIAEGVETEEQYRLMKKAGCDYLQGYYFSRPVPPEEFEKLFERK